MSEWGLPSIQTIDCVRVVVLGVGLSRGGASVAGRVTSAWAEPQRAAGLGGAWPKAIRNYLVEWLGHGLRARCVASVFNAVLWAWP